MAQFTVSREPATITVNVDIMVLDAGATAGGMGKVKMISWGGRGLTSTGYRTRWGTFATPSTMGSDPAGNLYSQDWNLLGGGGILVLPIGGEWFVVNSATAGHAQVAVQNTVGADATATSYGMQWEE